MKGKAQVQANLQRIAQELPKELAQALYTEAVIVEQTSRERTPVATGTLRASHETSFPKEDRDGLSVTIQVGGPAAPYAVKVHEMVEVYHKVGQAKFLESAVLEATPTLAARIAARVRMKG